MWEKEELAKKEEACKTMEDLYERDENPFVVLKLAEWLFELEKYQKCQQVVERALEGFSDEFKKEHPKAEEVITRLALFKIESIEN